MLYEHELTVALKTAAAADRLIMDHYAKLVVIPDAPANISTDTDRQSQETILQCLHAVFPNDALLAEENTPTAAATPKSGRRIWIIDPIDGTRGFARKNGEFSVMIAFVEDGKVVVGVVTEPAKDRRTYASLGNGCWIQDGSAPAVRCHVTAVAELADATVTQSHTKPGAPPGKELRALAPKRVIETYSAGVKLAQVARGEADIYLNTYDACHDWDHRRRPFVSRRGRWASHEYVGPALPLRVAWRLATSRSCGEQSQAASGSPWLWLAGTR